MIIGNYNIRSFVVGIQELPDKTAFILKHFRDVGLGDVEVFNGISGEVSGLETKWTYDVDNPGTNYRIGPKAATCVSFLMLWSAMLYMPEPYFWQLEYDCRFQTNWRTRLEQALQDVPPDFDLLYVGSCCCKDKPTTHIKGEVYEVKYPMCGHSIIIAKKALPVMLRTQRKIYAPVDIALAFHSMPALKVMTILPRCCDQFDTEISD